MLKTKITVFICCFVGYMVITYVRKTVSYASPAVMKSENMDESQLGIILSTQMIGYTVGKLVGGVFVDIFSPRLLLAVSVFLTGFTALLFTTLDSISLFTLCWFVNGLSQGPSWPACGILIKRWLPPEQLGTWWSVLSTSMNVSGTMGPILSTYLLNSFSWRFTVGAAGTFACGLSGLTFMMAADWPPGHPGSVSGSSTSTKTSSRTDVSSLAKEVLGLFRKPVFISVCVNYLLISFIRGSYSDWGHVYLVQDKGHSQLTGSSFISSQELGGVIGTLVAGFMSDYFISKEMFHEPRLVVTSLCSIVQTIGLFIFSCCVLSSSTSVSFRLYPLASLLFVNLQLLDSKNYPSTLDRFGLHQQVLAYSLQVVIVIQLFINAVGFMIGFGIYGAIALFGVVAMESSSDHLAGTAHAVICFASNMGIVLSGYPFSVIAKYLGWYYAFYLLQVVSLTSIAVALAGVKFAPRLPSLHRSD